MKCGCCGKDIGEFCFDKAFGLPDEVFEIPEEDREVKAKYNSDLCTIGGRYFIRTVLFIPVVDTDKRFGWGFWCEVSEEGFNKYLNVYKVDGINEPEISGTLANNIPSYPKLIGEPVKIQFGIPDQRPTSRLLETDNLLLIEQQEGITLERVHHLTEL